MRALLLALALLLTIPTAAADPPEVACDEDDDLYNHCHAGHVNWVTGPEGCVGLNVEGRDAECGELPLP